MAEPLGVRLDVNQADRASLARLVHALDPASPGAAIADAIIAARARPFGAVEELLRISDFEMPAALLAHLDVEHASVATLHAPAPVLASLPAFTPEVVAYVLWRRQGARPVQDLHDLLGGAPRGMRESLLSAYASISARATIEPSDWRVVARVTEPGTAPAVVEHLIRRTASGTVVTRERTW